MEGRFTHKSTTDFATYYCVLNADDPRTIMQNPSELQSLRHSTTKTMILWAFFPRPSLLSATTIGKNNHTMIKKWAAPVIDQNLTQSKHESTGSFVTTLIMSAS